MQWCRKGLQRRGSCIGSGPESGDASLQNWQEKKTKNKNKAKQTNKQKGFKPLDSV